MKANNKFNHWLTRLDKAMRKKGVRRFYPKRLAQAHWQDYFDDSYEPVYALLADLEYTDCD
jgi:hypothetical protein